MRKWRYLMRLRAWSKHILGRAASSWTSVKGRFSTPLMKWALVPWKGHKISARYWKWMSQVSKWPEFSVVSWSDDIICESWGCTIRWKVVYLSHDPLFMCYSQMHEQWGFALISSIPQLLQQFWRSVSENSSKLPHMYLWILENCGLCFRHFTFTLWILFLSKDDTKGCTNCALRRNHRTNSTCFTAW